jgi:hypothetical protein
MTTLNANPVSVACEICEVEVYAYAIWLDVTDNTQHYSCGNFNCECEFDNSNSMKFVEEVN